MLRKTTKAIKEYGLIEKGDNVLVAVSGGPDSVALLLALIKLAGRFGFSLAAAHLNHCLRGKDAQEDARFVRELADRLDIPLTSEEVDIKAIRRRRGGSIEEVARAERYAFLCRAAKSMGCNKVALGHTLDDNAETALMNLLRGSGVKGLGGIPPRRRLDGIEVIRPLILVMKDEVLSFLQSEKASYRTDCTNKDTVFRRNKIRHELIPLLKRDFNSKVVSALSGTAAVMRQVDEYIEAELERLMGEIVEERRGRAVLKQARLARLHPFMRKEVIRRILADRFEAKAGLSQLEKVDRFVTDGRGGTMNVSDSVTISRQYSDIIIRKQRVKTEKFEQEAPVPGEIFLRYFGTRLSTEIVIKDALVSDLRQKPKPFSKIWEKISEGKRVRLQEFFDAGKIHCDRLLIRNRRKGDRYRPIGLGGDKSVREIFIDEKIPVSIRSKVPLLVNGREILWIMGYRVSEKYKVTGATKRVLKVVAKIFYCNESS